jgi:hypothetical protein
LTARFSKATISCDKLIRSILHTHSLKTALILWIRAVENEEIQLTRWKLWAAEFKKPCTWEMLS